METRQEQDRGEVEQNTDGSIGQQGDQHIRPAVGIAEIHVQGDLIDVVADLTGEEDGQGTDKGGQLEGVTEGEQLREGESGGGGIRFGEPRAEGGLLDLAVVAGLGHGDYRNGQGVGDQLHNQHDQDDGNIREKFVQTGQTRVGQDIHDVVEDELACIQEDKSPHNALASLQASAPDRADGCGVAHGDHRQIPQATVNEVVQNRGIPRIHVGNIVTQQNVHGVNEKSLHGKAHTCDQ